MPSWDDYVDERQGGLLANYDGTPEDVYFTEGQSGVQLYLPVTIDNPEDYPNIPMGVCKNWFNLGPNWTIVQNGAAVEHADLTKFNGNTEAGRLLKQVKVIDPEGNTLANGSPLTAAYWKGLGHTRWAPISWKYESFTGSDGSEVSAGTKSKVMPVEILGGKAATNGSAPADFDLSILNLDTQTIDALTRAANTADSFSKFLPAALGLGLDQSVFAVVSNPQTGPQVYAALKPF